MQEKKTFQKMHFQVILFLGLFLMVFSTSGIYAQENPPIPVQVEVRTAKYLNFGSFTTGGGIGTVSVDYSGQRTSTGDVVLLNFGPSPSAALFDVTANPGTIISIQHMPEITLAGSNGGTLILEIDSYSTGTPVFISTANADSVNEVFIGGTLKLGTTTVPAGKYNGTMVIDFIQQ